MKPTNTWYGLALIVASAIATGGCAEAIEDGHELHHHAHDHAGEVVDVIPEHDPTTVRMEISGEPDLDAAEAALSNDPEVRALETFLLSALSIDDNVDLTLSELELLESDPDWVRSLRVGIVMVHGDPQQVSEDDDSGSLRSSADTCCEYSYLKTCSTTFHNLWCNEERGKKLESSHGGSCGYGHPIEKCEHSWLYYTCTRESGGTNGCRNAACPES